MQNKSLLVVLFELFVGLLESLNCRENRFKTEKKKTKQNQKQNKKKKKKHRHPQENLTKLWQSFGQ